MRLYSDYPGRRTAQIIADIVALALVATAIWIGIVVGGIISVLAGFGKTIEDAGNGFEKTLADAGNTLGGVPLIGGGIRAPFDAASGAGTLLAQAGQAQQDLVHGIALTVGIVVAVVPILVLVLIWLRPRLRFARRAGAAAALGALTDGPDLLALRALVSSPAKQLRGISHEPVDAWRRGDIKVVRALAQLELREAGVRLR